MPSWEMIQSLDDPPTSDELGIAKEKMKWGKDWYFAGIDTLWRSRITSSIISVNVEDMENRICG